MIDAVVLIAAAFLVAATAIALRIEIGTRSQAWQRIAEERRWDWEQRIGSSSNQRDW